LQQIELPLEGSHQTSIQRNDFHWITDQIKHIGNKIHLENAKQIEQQSGFLLREGRQNKQKVDKQQKIDKVQSKAQHNNLIVASIYLSSQIIT
jgi:hypothetical protein